MDQISGDSLRGHLEALVLATLDIGEAHGYQVLQRLERAGSGALSLKEGTLYPVLYRLEQAGCITARWESGQRRGPRRRIYRITAKGKRTLAHGRDAWRRLVSVIGGILEAGA